MEHINDTRIRVMAGVTMARAAVFAAGLGLSGMEFAHGIPGTVGGAVLMNAGAYGGEIKDTIVAVDVMTKDGEVRRLEKEDLQLSYRHSVMMESGDIVLKAYFTLKVRPNWFAAW